MQPDELVEIVKRAPFSALFGLLCSCKRLASTPVDYGAYAQCVMIDDTSLTQYPNGYRLFANWSVPGTQSLITYEHNVPIELIRSSVWGCRTVYFDVSATTSLFFGMLTIEAHGAMVLISTERDICQIVNDGITIVDDPTAAAVDELLSEDPTAFREAFDIIGRKFHGATKTTYDGIPSCLL